MLVIRDEQIQALIAPSEERLAELVAEAVRAAEPMRLAPLAPAQVDHMVGKCIARARDAGIKEVENIAAFAALMLVISPWFDRQPTIAGVMNDEKFSKGELLFQLFDRVPADAWQQAADSYDAKFWFENDGLTEAVFQEVEGESRPPDYAGLTLKQADIVDAAAKQMKESPSEASGNALALELERLCFYRAALNGTLEERAVSAASRARDFVLERAIARPKRYA